MVKYLAAVVVAFMLLPTTATAQAADPAIIEAIEGEWGEMRNVRGSVTTRHQDGYVQTGSFHITNPEKVYIEYDDGNQFWIEGGQVITYNSFDGRDSQRLGPFRAAFSTEPDFSNIISGSGSAGGTTVIRFRDPQGRVDGYLDMEFGSNHQLSGWKFHNESMGQETRTTLDY